MCGRPASEAPSFSESDIANAELLIPLEPESIIEELTLRGVQPAHAAMISHIVIQTETKIQQRFSCQIQHILKMAQRANVDHEETRSNLVSHYENTFHQRLDGVAVQFNFRPMDGAFRSN
ncbi:hypothetical protein NLI96_g2010 [Meripilus lineatus]|uniref:Uncharacterized protein n=1 Tax=Meripilus lineatus TaxID=2056292 RepID=A0AAD5VBU6_9APHY|nr:hypothetical protein NLI96_g2010 [Physisporinus lineatus]